ncbi:MAG: two-component sensor histidine kinase [Alphaproteobacteria bacterium]|nr:MAG: two-component sensor histidine kinase [Alphaproteobacteria bacterium]
MTSRLEDSWAEVQQGWISLLRRLKHLTPRGLFGRVLLIVILPVVLAQGVATYTFFSGHWETVTRRLASAIAGDSWMIVQGVERERGDPLRVSAFLEESYHGTEIRAELRPEGAMDPAPNLTPSLTRRLMAQAMRRKLEERDFWVDSQSDPELLRMQVALRGGGALMMSLPLKRLVTPSSNAFILWMLGSSLGLCAIAVLMMRNQIRPIHRLAEVVEQFGKGRDVPGYRPEGALEVRRAAVAFLLMRDRLRRQMAQRTAFLAGVSHDLRTPLTRMRLQLALLPDSQEIQDMVRDIGEMEAMVEGYLAFARDEEDEPRVYIDLAELLADLIEQENRTGGDVAWSQGAPAEPFGLTAPPRALRRCLGNLLGNAVRYGGRVRVGMQRLNQTAGDTLEVMIDDDGPGIPAEKREDVFRPFVRLDPARHGGGNGNGNGIGLGLTVARDIARRHGGEVTLGESPMGGLRATLRLPV